MNGCTELHTYIHYLVFNYRMASLIFAHAKSICKKAKSEAKDLAMSDEKLGKSFDERYQYWYDLLISREYDAFDEYIEVASKLHERYIAANGRKQSYFITIRPDCNKVDFITFKEKVESFVSRACFTEVTYSFEQKGTTPSEIGTGFHVHIVAQSKHRSKGECLRDTLSSWNTWVSEGRIAANCIDVAVTNNGQALIQNYLIDYKSDDNHKSPTKSMDELWRSEVGIQPLYKK